MNDSPPSKPKFAGLLDAVGDGAGTATYDDSVKTPRCTDFLKQRKIMINLVIMSVIWITATMNFYLI